MNPAAGLKDGLGPRQGLDAASGLRFQWVRRVADLDALAETAADEVLRISHEAIASRGVFRVALGGGPTPRPLHEILAGCTSERFGRWHFYWGDERYVPPDHPDSNFLMAQQTLIGRVPVAAHHVHRVLTEQGPPAAVASAYEEELRASFGCGPAEIPRFDLMLMGMGPDGHTASLFPGSPLLREQEALVASCFEPSVSSHRITMTLPLINAARAVIFTVAGAAAAPALRDVLDDRVAPEQRPARLVCPTDGTLLWIVDEAAARDG